MNVFRLTPDAPLDRRYLRMCAVYRLLMRRRVIGKARAVELLQARSVPHALGLVELWRPMPALDVLVRAWHAAHPRPGAALEARL